MEVIFIFGLPSPAVNPTNSQTGAITAHIPWTPSMIQSCPSVNAGVVARPNGLVTSDGWVKVKSAVGSNCQWKLWPGGAKPHTLTPFKK